MNKITKYLLGIGVLATLPFSVSGGEYLTVDLDCPTEAFAGDTISCTIKAPATTCDSPHAPSMTGLLLKYDIPQGITYDSFIASQEFNVQTISATGIAVGQTSGFVQGEECSTEIGVVKFKLDDDLQEGDAYTIGLTDVNMSDANYGDWLYPQLVGQSATITIVEDVLELDDALPISNNIFYNLLIGSSSKNILDLITTNGVKGIYNGNTLVSETDKIGTGYKVRVTLRKSIVEYTLSVKGDVTGSGKVTMADVMKAATHILEGNTITGEAYLKAADVTGDGNIKMSDVMKMANYVLEGGSL